jgi:hypothetical protein
MQWKNILFYSPTSDATGYSGTLAFGFAGGLFPVLFIPFPPPLSTLVMPHGYL